MFTKNVKNDPLVYSIKAVMEQNEHQRRVEALVNEHFGVQSKNNLPHELHSEYDAVFAQMMNEEKEDEGGMSGSATQHKQAAIKAHLSIKAGKKSPELMEKKKMHERMYKRLTGKDISYPNSINEKVKMTKSQMANLDGDPKFTANDLAHLRAGTHKKKAAAGTLEEKASEEQKAKVAKVMGEFKKNKLHSGSKKGPTVTDRDQAIAIALNQAGLSKKKKMDEQTSIDSVVEEIRNNLEEQLVYVYENYDESSFSEFVNSLSEEELSILELDSINEADGWQPPSKASVAVRDAVSFGKRHSDSGRAERRNYTQDVKTLNRQGMEDNPMSPASSRSDLQRNATPQSGGSITQSSQGGSYKSKAQSSGSSTTTGAAAPGGSITQRSQERSMAQSSGGSTTTGAAAPGGSIPANAGRGRMDVQGSAGPNATRVSKREGATGKALATSGISREMRRNQDYVTRTLGAGYKAGSKKANLALAAKAKQGPTASGGVMGAGAGGITQSSQRAPTKPIKESFESFLRNKFLKD